jgi:hypothetical protein
MPHTVVARDHSASYTVATVCSWYMLRMRVCSVVVVLLAEQCLGASDSESRTFSLLHYKHLRAVQELLT